MNIVGSDSAPATRAEAIELAKYALEEAENYQPRYDICTFYATMSIAYSTLAPLLPETDGEAARKLARAQQREAFDELRELTADMAMDP